MSTVQRALESAPYQTGKERVKPRYSFLGLSLYQKKKVQLISLLLLLLFSFKATKKKERTQTTYRHYNLPSRAPSTVYSVPAIGAAFRIRPLDKNLPIVTSQCKFCSRVTDLLFKDSPPRTALPELERVHLAHCNCIQLSLSTGTDHNQ